jgi:hypothetical protein
LFFAQQVTSEQSGTVASMGSGTPLVTLGTPPNTTPVLTVTVSIFDPGSGRHHPTTVPYGSSFLDTLAAADIQHGTHLNQLYSEGGAAAFQLDGTASVEPFLQHRWGSLYADMGWRPGAHYFVRLRKQTRLRGGMEAAQRADIWALSPRVLTLAEQVISD